MRRLFTALVFLAGFSFTAVAQTGNTAACANVSLGDFGSLNGWVPSPNDAWHTNIASAPVDPNSANIIGLSQDIGLRYLHPDFTIPYTVVDSTQTPLVAIAPWDTLDSDISMYPIPPNVIQEGNPGQCWTDGNDHHILIIDKNQCVSYEIYQGNLCNGSWTSYGNVFWDFTIPGGAQRGYGVSSVDAAGLSVFEGLVRYDEIVAGSINHAIRFTLSRTKADSVGGYFTAPAVHAAGNLWGTDNIMGMRIRLQANYDISGFSQTNQIILNAMKQYGMILADNGSDMFFQGTPDPRWDDNDLAALKSIPSTAFDVVQMGPVYDSWIAPTGPAPVINSFTASADNVAPGTAVTLTPDVTGGSYEFIGEVSFIRGPVTVYPTQTSTYHLASRNMYGIDIVATTVTVVPGNAPALNFTPVASQVFGVAPFAVTATSNSTGAITYSVLSGPASIAGNIVTITGVGSVTLQASQAAAGTYTATSAQTSFNVTGTVPTLSFGAVADQNFGVSPFAVSATSNSTGAITYSVVSGPATISGSTVTLTGSGHVTLMASQAAAGNFTTNTATVGFNVNAVAPTLTFSVGNQTYSAVPFPVVATSNSTGAITYSVLSGSATASGNAVTLTGTGNVTLQASQAAAGGYNAATANTTFNVAAATPSLSLSAVANQTYGAVPFGVSATSSSTGAITYSIVSGQAAIAGNVVTLTGIGPVTIQASQVAAGGYTSNTATTSFNVAAEPPTITFTPIGNQTQGAAPFAVSATSNSPAAITYSIATGQATIAGNIITLTGSGNVSVQASQAATGNFAAGTGNISFVVAGTTALAFSPIATQTFGAAPFAVSATSNSTGPITYSVLSGPATIAGNIVTLTGTGNVTLQASQAAFGVYSAATTTIGFSVSSATPTLTFSGIANQTYGATPFAVSATSNSTGAITYSVLSGPATIASNIVTLTGAGSVTLQASQAAAGNYAAATTNTSFNVSANAPTLSFNAVANQTYGGAPFAVAAVSNSTGAITYSVLSGPATISGNIVTLTGAGSVTLQASQAAAGGYAAATANTSFNVSANTPTLTFNAVANQTYGGAPFAVVATSNSTGAITYSMLSGPATLSGNIITLTGAGSVTLQASQAAAGGYAAATATTSFNVSANAPTLNFTAAANQTYGSAPFAVSATSNSTGAITYSVLSGPATISGNIVTLSGAGSVTLQASQAAAGGYAAATANTSFNVAAIAPTLNIHPIATQTLGAGSVSLSSTSNSTGAITYSVLSGSATIAGNSLTATGPGTITVQASQAAAGGYTAATASTTFTVNPGSTTLAFAAIASQTYGAPPIAVSAASNSPAPITYTVLSGPAMISGNVLSFTGIGTVILQATEPAAGNYLAATATTTVTVNPITPALSITSIPTQTYGAPSFTVSATSTSTAPITFAILSGPATITGNTVSLTGAGSVTLQATQPAAGNYLAAIATTTFSVAPSSVLLNGDFALSTATPNVTIPQGQTGTATISVTSINGFTGQIDFKCSLPNSMEYTTCGTTSAQLSPSAKATSTLTVATGTGPQMTIAENSAPSTSAKAIVALALLLPCGLPFFSRKSRKLRRIALGLVMAFSMAAISTGTTGCASGSVVRAVTPAGTYVLNLIATSGTTTHSMTLNIVVQQPTN